MADSRPLPGPCTRTCTRRSPRFIASRPQFSAATVAANGVDFFDPLNPAFPAEPHASVLPLRSVMVIRRLLNVAEMWAMPSDSTTFLLRLTLALTGAAGGGAGAAAVVVSGWAGVGFVILLLRHLLLARDGPARSLLGPRIGVRALAAHRQPASMPDSAIAPDIHQALDVHRDLGPERALDLDRPLDHLAETRDFRIRQIANAGVGTHTGLRENPVAGGPADAEDVGERDLHALFPWQIHAGDTRHRSALPLLVLGVALADDANDALSLDDFAVLADRLDARTNLHVLLSRASLRNSSQTYRGAGSNASRAPRRTTGRRRAEVRRSLEAPPGSTPLVRAG